MENRSEIEEFKKRSVLAICWAGSDRSKYISEELTQRGYIATHGGIMDGQNYVTKEDFNYVGSVIFSSKFEKEKFDKDINLKNLVERNYIQVFVMDITESKKDRAHNNNDIETLKKEISTQLDNIGFKKLEGVN